MPDQFHALPDFANLNDRQLALLVLYEVMENRTEIRTLETILLSTVGKDVDTAKLESIADKVRADVLRDVISHAQDLMRPGQRPEQN